MNLRRNGTVNWPLLLLLVTRLALGSVFSLINPLWEAYDEDGHFAYAHYLAAHRHLLQAGDPEAEAIWERFQPPLYYLLLAPVIAGFDLKPGAWEPERNPYFTQGNAGLNYALHAPTLNELEARTRWAVWAARLLTVLITTASVFWVYQTGGLLWPDSQSRRWLATCVYAFWPLFLFVGSMITNDAPIAALAALLVYQMVQLVKCGFTLRRLMGLGVTVGIAVLTKLNALAFIPVVALAVGLSLPAVWADLRRRWQFWVALGVTGGGMALALGLVATSRFATQHVFSGRTLLNFLKNLGYVQMLPAAYRYSFKTLIASFGWANVEANAWVYTLWAWGAGLALLGLGVGLARRACVGRGRLLGLLGWQGLVAVGLSSALVVAEKNMYLLAGRYLFTALPAAVLLLVEFWSVLAPRRQWRWIWKVIGVVGLGIGWLIPGQVFMSAYARPLPAAVETLDDFQPLLTQWAAPIDLLGYRRPADAVAGQAFKITLCWQARAPITENYTVDLELVGPVDKVYGTLRTYPGRGNYATSFWAVNTPFCDMYEIPVSAEFPAPAAARIKIALGQPLKNSWVPMLRASTPPAEAVLPPAPYRLHLPLIEVDPSKKESVSVPLKVLAATAPPRLAHAVHYQFGEGLLLQGYELKVLTDTRAVQIVLDWQVLESVREDYTIFVHLRDTPLTAYAYGDSPPRQGWYPTFLWGKGERIRDEHRLPIAAGPVPPLALYVGVYLPPTYDRLPVWDAQGQPVLNGEVILAQALKLDLPVSLPATPTPVPSAGPAYP